MKQLGGLFAMTCAALLLMGWTTSRATAAAPQVITISEQEFSLTPNQFTVTAGEPVRFQVTDNGNLAHNAAVGLPSASIEQTLFDANLKPGETRTAEFTFTQAGNWALYCPVSQHASAGMQGIIVVQAPATGGASIPVTPTSQSPTPATVPTAGGPTITNALLLLALSALIFVCGGLFILGFTLIRVLSE